jgi:hypothetical protein
MSTLPMPTLSFRVFLACARAAPADLLPDMALALVFVGSEDWDRDILVELESAWRPKPV